MLSQYDYDDNGNRLSHTTPGGTVTGSYDDQDRLASYGDWDFTFGANGELETKTDGTDTTTYVYDARGSLLSVTLPDATLIEYVIDGQARRVGRKIDGVLVQGFLYKDQLRIAAELDAAGEVVSHFSYIGGSHSPDWMTKGGALYRFVKDQVGSVRLVVNAITGDVAQEMEYDEFGVVLTDSSPGFQPFGFAGGLYDVDTGLTRFGARDYDATVGRWTSKDPIRWRGGQENLYVYAGNDAVNRIDPSGLEWDAGCTAQAGACAIACWSCAEKGTPVSPQCAGCVWCLATLANRCGPEPEDVEPDQPAPCGGVSPPPPPVPGPPPPGGDSGPPR